MNIGLDYDDTVTRDPLAFLEFIKMFRQRGHNVYIVTMRFESECSNILDYIKDSVNGIYPTGRMAKEKFMYARGIRIDVWIDDNPKAVHMDADTAFGYATPEGQIVNKTGEATCQTTK